MRNGWVAALAIALLASACTRSIHFPPTEVQNLRPLADARSAAGPGLGEQLVTGAGEAVGLADPDASVVLGNGDETVLVHAHTELVLHAARPPRELAFRPATLSFGETELSLDRAGTRRVPYPNITGLELEKFSFGRTILWTVVIGVTILLTLSLIVLAAGGGGGGDGDDDIFD